MNISKPGTGGRAKTGCPVGGKTGTTDENSDAWFVGFSPRLATSVWVGFPQGRIPMGPLFHGANVDGGTFPAQIWGEYMKAAARGFCGDFKKPDKPFKPKAFKPRDARPAPVQPSLSAEELAAQARRAQQQAQADHSAVKPGAGAPQAPQVPQTGGKGYDPGAYNPDIYDNPPQQEVPPDTGAGEPQATPP